MSKFSSCVCLHSQPKFLSPWPDTLQSGYKWIRLIYYLGFFFTFCQFCVSSEWRPEAVYTLQLILWTTHMWSSIDSDVHYLYADNTQLFFSFSPSDFDVNISLLRNALQQISSWMTANLPTHSVGNLGFIFDEHLSFSDQISSLSKSSYPHICELCCIHPYLDFKTANTIATSIVILQTRLLQLIELTAQPTETTVKPASTDRELSCSHCCWISEFYSLIPVLKSLYWLKINECIEYILLSLTYKSSLPASPLISAIWSLSSHSQHSILICRHHL